MLSAEHGEARREAAWILAKTMFFARMPTLEFVNLKVNLL